MLLAASNNTLHNNNINISNNSNNNNNINSNSSNNNFNISNRATTLDNDYGGYFSKSPNFDRKTMIEQPNNFNINPPISSLVLPPPPIPVASNSPYQERRVLATVTETFKGGRGTRLTTQQRSPLSSPGVDDAYRHRFAQQQQLPNYHSPPYMPGPPFFSITSANAAMNNNAPFPPPPIPSLVPMPQQQQQQQQQQTQAPPPPPPQQQPQQQQPKVLDNKPADQALTSREIDDGNRNTPLCKVAGAMFRSNQPRWGVVLAIESAEKRREQGDLHGALDEYDLLMNDCMQVILSPDNSISVSSEFQPCFQDALARFLSFVATTKGNSGCAAMLAKLCNNRPPANAQLAQMIRSAGFAEVARLLVVNTPGSANGDAGKKQFLNLNVNPLSPMSIADSAARSV